tara:strand:+ start:9628 stop:9942 length:315 start_codon:yes stop_codon:yes gene_type:complete
MCLFLLISYPVSGQKSSGNTFQTYFTQVDSVIPSKIDLSGSLRVILHESKYYVMDLKKAKIFVLNSDGELLHEMGRHGRGPGEFERLNSIALSETVKLKLQTVT